MKGAVYLDNAATTMKKPPSVKMAVSEWIECGNAGRGSHRLALAASEKIYEARVWAARLFGAEAENVAFTSNATYALNMAIKGLIPHGSHIITSDFEHNSVRRPVLSMCKYNGCERDTFISEREEYVIKSIERKLKRNTSAVVCLHRSNITGRTLPVARIGRLCRERGILFIVDASQSAGNAKIDVVRDNIDVLCTAGHKGLYGPQGTGLVVMGKERKMRTLIEGGSGTDSRAEEMPQYLPDRLEAGTLPTASIAGLLEGIRFVHSTGEENIHRYECALWRRCVNELDNRRIMIYDIDKAGANLLFNISALSPSEVSAELDRRGICTRAGLHCSPDAHASLTTGEAGAVRVSFSYLTTEAEVDYFINVIKNIVSRK